MKTFLVYMHNAVNRDDDEVYKVYADNPEHAKNVAREKMEWPGRFSAGWALPYFPENERDRDFLKSYRWWATDKRTGDNK